MQNAVRLSKKRRKGFDLKGDYDVNDVNDSVQAMQVRALISRAVEERDEARAAVVALGVLYRHERKVNRICLLLLLAETAVLAWIIA